MKVKYEVDKYKFTKVYNELKIDTSNLPDYYSLASKHDKTNDKDIKDIVYAIKHNINFEITDINTVKKINEMYDYYEKPNRLTQQEIIDCIKEFNELWLKIQTQTCATIMKARIIGKDNDNKVKMVLTLCTNYYHSPMQTICTRQGSLSEVLDEIKEYERVNHIPNNEVALEVQHKILSGESVIGNIFK